MTGGPEKQAGPEHKGLDVHLSQICSSNQAPTDLMQPFTDSLDCYHFCLLGPLHLPGPPIPVSPHRSGCLSPTGSEALKTTRIW